MSCATYVTACYLACLLHPSPRAPIGCVQQKIPPCKCTRDKVRESSLIVLENRHSISPGTATSPRTSPFPPHSQKQVGLAQHQVPVPSGPVHSSEVGAARLGTWDSVCVWVQVLRPWIPVLSRMTPMGFGKWFLGEMPASGHPQELASVNGESELSTTVHVALAVAPPEDQLGQAAGILLKTAPPPPARVAVAASSGHNTWPAP